MSGERPRIDNTSSSVVSISQSRGFSFQALRNAFINPATMMFQSRNRDAFHFRCYCEYNRTTNTYQVSISQSRCFSVQGRGRLNDRRNRRIVSISQSRCFSFQGRMILSVASPGMSFNLAIEMLFISGELQPIQTCGVRNRFQSRNRDAFHFR